MRWDLENANGRHLYHTLRCTMPSIGRGYANPGDEDHSDVVVECGEDVFLAWSLTCPADLDLADDGEAAKSAWNSSWEVRCCAGHVMAVGSDEDRDAPAYDPRMAGVPPEPCVACGHPKHSIEGCLALRPGNDPPPIFCGCKQEK